MRHALLRTLPGRAIVIGLAIKLAVFFLRTLAGQMPASVGVFDTAGSIAVASGGGYFLVRGMAFVRRRLLWRVRRKLIISYIFVGFVPAILIIAFFLLGGVPPRPERRRLAERHRPSTPPGPGRTSNRPPACPAG